MQEPDWQRRSNSERILHEISFGSVCSSGFQRIEVEREFGVRARSMWRKKRHGDSSNAEIGFFAIIVADIVRESRLS